MLYDHNSETRLPIGTWDDLRVEADGSITAIPVFDEQDEFAMSVKKKVDAGILKMASISARPIEVQGDRLTKWALREISITPFGGNYNAFRLYDTQGNLINLNEQNQFFNNLNTLKMSETNTLKVTLVAGLNLSDNVTDGELIRNVLKLSAENTALKAEVADYKAKEQTAKQALELRDKETVVDAAVTAKKITAAQKPAYMKLELNDVKTILEGMPAPVDISAVGTPGKVTKPEGVEKLSFVELSEKHSGYLAELKLNDKDQYKKLFKAEYGVEPKNI